MSEKNLVLPFEVAAGVVAQSAFNAGRELALTDAVAAIRKESHLLALDAWIEERLAAAIRALKLEEK